MATASDTTNLSGLLAQVDKHIQQKERSEAFKILNELRVNFRGSEADQLRIATGFGKIGEWSVAGEIRRGIAAKHPDDFSLRLAVFEARVRNKRNPDFDVVDLDKLMSSRDADAACWNHAAHLYADLGFWRKSLKAATKCVDLSKRDPRYMEFYIAVLANLRKFRTARAELRALLARSDIKPGLLRECGDLALRIRDKPLAMKFAEAQYLADKTNQYAIIYLARYCRLARHEERARELLTGLWAAQGKSPTLPHHLWMPLAQQLYDVGCTKIAKEVALQIVARNPDNRDAQALVAAIKYLEERGAGDILNRPPVGRKGGLLTWLGLQVLRASEWVNVWHGR